MSTLPHHDTSEDRLPRPGDRVSEGKRWVEVYSRAKLPTRYGRFAVFVLRNSEDGHEHVVLARGQVRSEAEVPMRLHSECLTGDVLGSLRCDCRDQLEMALATLGASERGLFLYMRQEGRGIGLGNKVRAYALQELGLDTFEANRHLGFDDDLRDYAVAALAVRLFAPASVQLATNNPRKIFGLRKHGIEVAGRQPLVADANPHNSDYLRTKAQKSGHLLPFA